MAKNAFFIVSSQSNSEASPITAGMLACARQNNLSTVAIKPVATGCIKTEEGLRSKEVLTLIEQMSVQLHYDQINPVALESSAEPLLAATEVGRRLNISQMVGYTRSVMMQAVDLVLVEATGSWREPVNLRETMSGLPRELNLPVILVVNIQPGCINQCLLTVEAIVRDGAKLAGWVANGLVDCHQNTENMNENSYQQYLATIKSFIRAPCIGEIPIMENVNPEEVASYINWDFVITSGN